MLAVALSLCLPANKHPTLLHIKHCEALWRELLASWIPGAVLALTSWALPSSPLKSQQLREPLRSSRGGQQVFAHSRLERIISVRATADSIQVASSRDVCVPCVFLVPTKARRCPIL